MKFASWITYASDAATVAELRPQHRAYLAGLLAKGAGAGRPFRRRQRRLVRLRGARRSRRDVPDRPGPVLHRRRVRAGAGQALERRVLQPRRLAATARFAAVASAALAST